MVDSLNNFKFECSYFGAADIHPLQTGLDVHIWSMHHGSEIVSNYPKCLIKIGWFDYWVIVTAEENPETIITNLGLPDSEAFSKILSGVEYVQKNFDIFSKHYFDTEDKFDDDDLIKELSKRNCYSES